MFIKRSSVCCYRMSIGYVWGEVVELLEEVVKLNWKGIVGEWCDVYTCFMVWLSDVSGLDLYIVNNRSIESWFDRWEWWRKWLGEYGLKFKSEYMRYGANHEKESKRDKVLELAVKDQIPLDYYFLVKNW